MNLPTSSSLDSLECFVRQMFTYVRTGHKRSQTGRRRVTVSCLAIYGKQQRTSADFIGK